MVPWFFVLATVFMCIGYSTCHVINYDSVTVCDGVLKEIQCPPSENIHVLQGFYGKWRNHDCKGESIDPDNLPTCSTDRSKVIGKVRDLCHGKNTCTLVADKSIYGEPCPDNKAYLYMTFFCMRNGQKLVHHRNQKNEEVVTVPSHGYIVREEEVHLEEQRRKKEQEDAKREELLKLNDPSLLSPNPKPEADVNKEIEEAKTKQNTPQMTYSKQKVSKTKQLKVPPSSNFKTNVATDSLQKPSKITPNLKANKANSQKQKSTTKSQNANGRSTVKFSDEALAEQKSLIFDYLLRSQIPRKTATKVKNENKHNMVIEGEESKKSLVVNEKSEDIHQSEEEFRKKSKEHEDGEFVDSKLDKIAEQLKKEEIQAKTPASNETVNEDIRSATICNGESKLIACLPEEGIKIHDAFYGKRIGEDCHGKLPYQDDAPTCSALDAKTNVEESCNDKQSCLLFANENVYGKSLCPNVNKYLNLDYSCSPIPMENTNKQEEVSGSHSGEQRALNNNETTSNSSSSTNGTAMVSEPEMEEDAVSRTLKELARVNTTQILCNGEKRTLKCTREPGLAILSAFYGKRTGRDCRGDLSYRDDIPECNSPRAFEYIKKLCEKKQSCDIAAERDIFGKDECPGVNKYLEVSYAC